jgi:hypothetical protein
MKRFLTRMAGWRGLSLACWLCLALRALAEGATERLFQESKENFANPERGFYSQRTTGRMSGLEKLREQGATLVLVEMDLRGFKEKELTRGKLDELRKTLATAREAGLKVIFRAAYGFTDRDYRTDPKDLRRIIGHVKQIGAVLRENADTLLAVQAGFLGPWGEWHDSNWGDPPNLIARRAVLFALLDAVPAPIPVQVRRPMFIRDMFGLESAGAVAAEAGPSGDSKLGRVGWHDDAFLALPDDMGTYVEAGWNRERELLWCDNHDRYVPFGGETVGASASTPIDEVVREMELLHLSYLNNAYHPKTLQNWHESQIHGENAYGYIERHMGYRLVAQRLRYSTEAGANGRFSFELTLTNAGFAAPVLPRIVSVGLIQGDQVVRQELKNLDPRLWGPWSGNISVRGEVVVPDHFMDNRRVQFAVQLADPSPRLKDDGRFAIRLANDGVPFLAKEGWNVLVEDVAVHR